MAGIVSRAGVRPRAAADRTGWPHGPGMSLLCTGRRRRTAGSTSPTPLTGALGRSLGARIYRGLDLELLDLGNEDKRTFLIEAQHPEFAAALRGDENMVVDGEPVNPRLHVAMHQIVANQLLADDPPETWQTVQRLDGLGYDWHNIMHTITSLVSEDIYRSLKEHRQPDPAGYARRLNELPGDWPPPETDR